MRYNKLIPELSVSDFNKSLDFYTKILNFKIEYARELFAFLSLEGSQLMIDGKNESGPWFTGKLEYPRGRGIHLQLEVKDVLSVLKRLEAHNYPVKESLKEYWFRKNNELVGVKGFLVMDPDGYLLMFNEDIGRKPV